MSRFSRRPRCTPYRVYGEQEYLAGVDASDEYVELTMETPRAQSETPRPTGATVGRLAAATALTGTLVTACALLGAAALRSHPSEHSARVGRWTPPLGAGGPHASVLVRPGMRRHAPAEHARIARPAAQRVPWRSRPPRRSPQHVGWQQASPAVVAIPDEERPVGGAPGTPAGGWPVVEPQRPSGRGVAVADVDSRTSSQIEFGFER